MNTLRLLLVLVAGTTLASVRFVTAESGSDSNAAVKLAELHQQRIGIFEARYDVLPKQQKLALVQMATVLNAELDLLKTKAEAFRGKPEETEALNRRVEFYRELGKIAQEARSNGVISEDELQQAKLGRIESEIAPLSSGLRG